MSTAQVKFNGDLEEINLKAKLPSGWESYIPNNYDYTLDSTIVKKGKYSVSITSKTGEGKFGAISCLIPQTLAGTKLKLKCFIKTENVAGYAGLYVRIDGTSAFDNMYNQNIKGTADWKEYTIELPYNSDDAEQIVIGALLAGSGKMWFDDVRLYLDDKPIEQAAPKPLVKAKTDKAFANSSGIQTINTDPQTLKNLALLAQVWGFVKYHLPAVAKGGFNMDAELFRVMPAILKATDTKQACDSIERWVDKLGTPAACSNCKTAIKGKVMIKPDYGDIFDNKVVSASLINKLRFILDNSNITKNYYIEMKAGTNNPVFKNELAYANVQYIDAGMRLLSLFRYWNMFQYFSPYRDITGQNWKAVLHEFIPKFIAAKADIDYQLATLSLIAKVNDTHANVWSNLKALNQYKGNFIAPFLANFIEDKLVVTGFYKDTLKVKDNFKIGDVIITINGTQVKELVKKNLPYTAASNYPTQLRDMPSTILRFNDTTSAYQVIRDGKTMTISQRNAQRGQLYFNMFNTLKQGEPGFKLINDQVAYLYPGGYHSKDLPAIKAMFDKTRALIIDMRCYPSEFMPFSFVPYIRRWGRGPCRWPI
jgi:hypothetical protein